MSLLYCARSDIWILRTNNLPLIQNQPRNHTSKNKEPATNTEPAT